MVNLATGVLVVLCAVAAPEWWRSYDVANRCVKCGYDLRAHAAGQRCPECGTVVIDMACHGDRKR